MPPFSAFYHPLLRILLLADARTPSRSALPSFAAQQLAQIRAVAGAASLSLPPGALDEDFDPDAHEAAMGAAFGDDYYGEDDADERASRCVARRGCEGALTRGICVWLCALRCDAAARR